MRRYRELLTTPGDIRLTAANNLARLSDAVLTNVMFIAGRCSPVVAPGAAAVYGLVNGPVETVKQLAGDGQTTAPLLAATAAQGTALALTGRVHA